MVKAGLKPDVEEDEIKQIALLSLQASSFRCSAACRLQHRKQILLKKIRVRLCHIFEVYL